MKNFSIITLLAISSPALVHAQGVAAGGGLDPAVVAPTQYPVVTKAPSLSTNGVKTTAVYVEFTQTFAATALGSWDLGPTPLAGTIGLGSIQGEVGNVGTKNAKRSAETPAPGQWGWAWGKQH